MLKKNSSNYIKMLRRIIDNKNSISTFITLSIPFALSYMKSPLFSSNQNTSFLHELSQEGRGFLANDWLAKTTDPFPVFTALVKYTIHILPIVAFYIFHILFLGVYIFYMIGIITTLFPSIKKTTPYTFQVFQPFSFYFIQ